ncbi:MAG: aldo/keto reductase, partial [Alphaproteobacteria bacterium]|nr:aldo/keto reductase [Alphaproteobacteria bacterium]
MKTRKLGQSGLEVSAVGLGCMVMPGFYGPGEEADSIATLHRAADIGVTMIDTSDAYGGGKNEELVGRAIKDRRGDYTVATKFGNIRDSEGKPAVDGRPEYVAEACDKSLSRLGIDVIDLYYQHRVDPSVPIEDTVGAMARLVEAGKARYLGLSEAAPETVRRAHATHPIAALQTEYSLWTRMAEDELLPLCGELGIGYVAYSPLGRGMFGGQISGPESLAEGDRRANHPRFQDENLARNLKLVEPVRDMAAAKGCSVAQVA